MFTSGNNQNGSPNSQGFFGDINELRVVINNKANKSDIEKMNE